MFLIIHALFGAIIGLNFNSLLLITLIAVFSHFLFDMIPHWDGHFDKRKFQLFGHSDISRFRFMLTFIDSILSLSLIIIFYFIFNSWIVCYAMFMTMIPDVINLVYFTNLKDKKIFMNYLKFHSKIQNEVNIKIGLLVQMVFLILLSIILFLGN